MLLQLDIRNIALIDEVNIELGEGLNILTGETGAGKSIIIDSINAVLGERTSREVIRTGSEKASIDAVFQVDADVLSDIFDEIGVEPEEDGTLILSREITQSGRNTCRVNGKIVPVSIMKTIGERLIDIHGQHDNQSLLRTQNHIDLLDSFGGDRIGEIKRQYSKLLEQYKQTLAQIKAITADPAERERKLDILNFQIAEISDAKLKTGEEEELGRQRLLLANAEKIASSLGQVYSGIITGDKGEKPAVDMMNDALYHLSSMARLGEKYDELAGRLQDIIYQVDDLGTDIRKELDQVEVNPALLEQIEERLDLIYKLKRKYGESIEKIHEFYESALKQRDEIIKTEEIANELGKKRIELEAALYDLASKLNQERVKAASLLEDRICTQLDDLEMKRAKFKVDIQFDTVSDNEAGRKFTANGLDRVEFLISPNAGEPLKPLAKIASGGEMSRIMLAIKTILAQVDKIPTMIFDEIDSGVSGRAAQKVGEKLSYISNSHQVICVTHLAQIASMADNHFLIEKIYDKASTITKVSKLDNESIIKEISRLVGGSDSSYTSLKYAEEMVQNAKRIKNS